MSQPAKMGMHCKGGAYGSDPNSSNVFVRDYDVIIEGADFSAFPIQVGTPVQVSVQSQSSLYDGQKEITRGSFEQLFDHAAGIVSLVAGQSLPETQIKLPGGSINLTQGGALSGDGPPMTVYNVILRLDKEHHDPVFDENWKVSTFLCDPVR